MLYVRECMQGTVWTGPDEYVMSMSMLHVPGQARYMGMGVGGVAGCCWETPVCITGISREKFYYLTNIPSLEQNILPKSINIQVGYVGSNLCMYLG